MKRSDFAVFLNKYLTDYLVNTRGSTDPFWSTIQMS